MSAKTKALQTMAVFSIAALTYTLYNSSSTNEAKSKTVLLKQQNIIPAVGKAKASKENNASVTGANNSTQATVPGYCNPDESGR